MAIDDFKKFLRLIVEDKDIGDRLQTLGADWEAIIQFGQELNCHFTLKDIRMYHQQRMSKLSERELVDVAGGTNSVFVRLMRDLSTK